MMGEPRRILPSLDGIRGLAILMVLTHNVQMLDAPHLMGWAKATQYVLNLGWIGVQLFFVLSGFLITGILLDTCQQPHALGRFMARRALRIFPLYYLTLGVIFMVLPLLGLQPQIYQAEAPQQVWLWTYLDNWASPMGWGTGALPHFWSLAVEEQFYLVWPLIVLAMASVRSVAYIAIALALISLVSRVWLWQTGHSTEEIYQWTICRLDALCLGALAAACWRDPAWRHRLAQTAMPLGWLTAGLFIVGALITKGYPRSSPMGQTLGYAILSIVFSVGVYAAACRDVSGTSSKTALFVWHRLLQHPALRRLGQYSYGIYVMHKPMHDLLSKPLLRLLHWQPAAHIGVALAHIGLMLALSYGAAVLSYHLYEVHFLRLKNLFD